MPSLLSAQALLHRMFLEQLDRVVEHHATRIGGADFAELLDRDPHKLVNWWHRNLPDKPWSVNVLMPSGKGFYPDFVIGIEGRKTEQNALLADPKERFLMDAPKVLAEHRTYGRVMIIAKEGARWMTVGYDDKAQKPIFAREFTLIDAAAF